MLTLSSSELLDSVTSRLFMCAGARRGDVMGWEDEVGRSQGLSCGRRAVTGSSAEQLSTEGSGCAGTAEALWWGTAEPLGPCRGPVVPDWLAA